MADIATVNLSVKVVGHVWMYAEKWRVVVALGDEVEPIAEAIEADRRGLI